MPIKSVDADTLRHWLQAGQTVLVDVREPAEHATARIDGARCVPLAELAGTPLHGDGGTRLVLHCQSGRRSLAACEKLQAENAELDIYNLEGGISAWQQAGLPVVRSGGRVLPLDRQVQLAIGLLLLAGSVMGYLHSPAWLLLTGFVGAGLAMAGLTGFCGMALLIARMPWNQRTAGNAGCRIP